MPTAALPREVIEQAVALVEEALRAGYHFGRQPSAITEAARRADCLPQQIQHRLRVGEVKYGLIVDRSLDSAQHAAEADALKPAPERPTAEDELREENRRLRAELTGLKRQEVTRDAVWKHVAGLAQVEAAPPKWLVGKRRPHSGLLGVPVALWSDWHWSEVVRPSEMNGANEFNLEIAHRRARRLVDMTVAMLRDHLVGAQYDGIVVALGGDMLSGDIHEELTATNELPVIPALLDLFGVLVAAIGRVADEFGAVYVPCVTGNHGRTTKRIQSKERYATSFDWLLYALLAKHFEADKRITVHASQSPEIEFRVYSHGYHLTHGDSFKGGDGIIGALGPVTRGRVRRQARDAALHRHWQTMICGHWHTLCQLPHLVVNGSLIGYNEYAQYGNFGYERPAQALWITHPVQGITHQMPIYLDEPASANASPWVSVPRAA